MNHELLAVLRGQELTSGHNFPGLTNSAPPPWKYLYDLMRLNRCCRRQSRRQKSNKSASTSSDEYMGWIMIFWPSSEDKNSPQGLTFQVWLMQLPLPAICLMGQHWRLDAARCPQANKGEVWVALKATTSEFFQGSSTVHLTHGLLEKVTVK